ncbi:MAG: redoxin domain-containing protein [Candidatus Eisenbacteria bacterium]|nr:redoxin domain-containing protein [Candidatus Eisenbacteria bacterium]
MFGKSLGGLSYPLLSDFWPHGEVAQKYGVFDKKGFSERATFIIDEKGIVRYKKVNPLDVQRNNFDLMKALDKLD